MKTTSHRIEHQTSLLSALLATGLFTAGVSSALADSLEEALRGGEASLDIRLRYEWVRQDGAADNARASTVRTRIGYRTGTYRGLQAFVEMENTSAVGSEGYRVPGASPYGPRTPGRPIVADPLFTELNQAWLELTGPYTTRIRYGRQRVTLDNHRFIGNVGWRQNEQTYDALTLRNTAVDGLSILYGYFTNANTVIGTDRRMGSHVLNVSYGKLPLGRLTAYAYLLDFEAGAGTDSRTVGARLAGELPAGDLRLGYLIEYAQQDSYADSSGLDHAYHRLELGLGLRGLTFRIGEERLGGDGGTAFQTPLATLHAMNGWADRFLTTPADGLVDRFLSVGGKVAGIALRAVYHDFSADRGDRSYGDEIDLLALYRFGRHITLGVKYAGYDADSFSVDTDKAWVWIQARR